MWKPMSEPHGTIPLVHKHTTCQHRIGPPHMPNHLPRQPLSYHQLPHVRMIPCHFNTYFQSKIHVTLPHVSTVTLLRVSMVCTVNSMDGTDCTVNKKIACLTKWKEGDISRIRRLFEPVQVALGS
jgi:hypothetical protein